MYTYVGMIKNNKQRLQKHVGQKNFFFFFVQRKKKNKTKPGYHVSRRGPIRGAGTPCALCNILYAQRDANYQHTHTTTMCTSTLHTRSHTNAQATYTPPQPSHHASHPPCSSHPQPLCIPPPHPGGACPPAPRSSYSLSTGTTSPRPLASANSSGVLPACVFACTFAPASSSSLTHCSSPRRAASCKGVHPWLLLRLTLHLRPRSIMVTRRVFPWVAAQWRGVVNSLWDEVRTMDASAPACSRSSTHSESCGGGG